MILITTMKKKILMISRKREGISHPFRTSPIVGRTPTSFPIADTTLRTSRIALLTTHKTLQMPRPRTISSSLILTGFSSSLNNHHPTNMTKR
jgi:hypothetical protein